jgi:ferrous iron transport protein B
MATIYAVGDDDESGDALAGRLQNATWPDGAPVFTLATALGLLVFYAFCLQCAATVVIIWRETNSWRWPVFAWTYMTAGGYAAAWATYEFTNLLV